MHLIAIGQCPEENLQDIKQGISYPDGSRHTVILPRKDKMGKRGCRAF